MATAKKIQSDISSLKVAIRVAKNEAIKKKLKSRLEMAENELASIKSGAKPRKVSTSGGTKSLLQRAKDLVKKNKKFASYKGSGVDLEKDAKEGALRIGRRVSKGIKGNQYASKEESKGNVYYEYRVNRLDVKQPKKKQTYPKLEDGGYMAKGGFVAVSENDGYWYIISRPTTKEEAQKMVDMSKMEGEVGKVVTLEQAKAHKKVIGREYLANGGMMAKGGKLEDQYEGRQPEDIWNNLSKGQRQHFIYDHSSEIEGYRGQELGELSSSEIIKAYNSDYSQLDKNIKNRFNNHVRQGQYKDGGMMAKGGKTKSMYKEFFEKFNSKNIYIGSIVKNRSGNELFEIESYNKDITNDIKQYLDKNGIKYNINTINPNKIIIFLNTMESGGYMAKGGGTKKFVVDDVVYNKRTKTIGIVRLEDERGETKTDADGNVNTSELQHYNPMKYSNQKDAKVAPSTFKEIEERGLWQPFKKRGMGGYMAHGGETHRAEDPEVEIDEEEMKVVRGYSDDEAYEYAKGGVTPKAGDIVEATTGVKLKVMDFKPDFGGRALVKRIDEFGEGLKPVWMPLTKFKLPKLV